MTHTKENKEIYIKENKEVVVDNIVDNTTTAKNDRTQEIFDIIESQMFIPISAIVVERVRDWKEQYSDDLIIEALKRSVLANVRNLRYPDSILLEWSIKSIKTVDEIDKKDMKPTNRQAKRIVEPPDWLKEGPKNEQEEPKEQVNEEELKKILESFKN